MQCKRGLTQNVNESLHSKLWRLVNKAKHFTLARYNFAIQLVMLIHNFGYVDSSLLPEIGGMTESDLKVLTSLNQCSIDNAVDRKKRKEKYGRVHKGGKRDSSMLYYMYGAEFEWDQMGIVTPPDARNFFGDEALDLTQKLRKVPQPKVPTPTPVAGPSGIGRGGPSGKGKGVSRGKGRAKSRGRGRGRGGDQ